MLGDNDGNGLMFETEGDTLANVFNSDYGNYSDGFSKAFHHEAISYTRRKDREFVELLRPRLSTVLFGTSRQISALIPDAENGLFSRFIFYYINFRLEWIDVFAQPEGSTLDEIFDDIGLSFLYLYQMLGMQPDIELVLTKSQQQDFNAYYATAQREYYDLFGDDIIASVRRLGLITFRLAMILSALRLLDTGELPPSRLVCLDEDFRSAMAVSRVLIKHTARVFRELSTAELDRPAAERSDRQDRLLQALPAEFDTAACITLAARLGIARKSVERYLKQWRSTEVIRRISHGHYAKQDPHSPNPSNPHDGGATIPIMTDNKTPNPMHTTILIDNGHGSDTPPASAAPTDAYSNTATPAKSPLP